MYAMFLSLVIWIWFTNFKYCKVIDYTNAKFNKECASIHNHYRALHNSLPLKLNREIVKFARKRARTLAKQNNTEVLQHDPQDYGENLAAWPESSRINCSLIIELWFEEGQLISNWSDPESSGLSVYHFTQVVWRKTKSLGCGIAGLDDVEWVFIVCNYYPPGNYDNEFLYNVLPPIDYNSSIISKTKKISSEAESCTCVCNGQTIKVEV